MNISPKYKAQIKRALFLTKFNAWIEKCWPIVLSFLSIWGIYLCFGLLGIPQSLPDILRALLLAAISISSIGLVIYQARTIPYPTFQELLQRLEEHNKLTHQPLQTLYDTPVQTESKPVWNTHLQRIFEEFPRLKAGGPQICKGHYTLNRIGIVTVCMFAAFYVSHPHSSPSRLLSAVHPGYDDVTVPLPTLQAWIIPPSYSNSAPIYIKSNTQTVTTDPKARLHIALSDLKQSPEIINPEGNIVLDQTSIQQLDHSQWQVEGNIQHSGIVKIKARGRILASWTFNLPANLPPQITWTGPVQKSAYDWKTEFPFKVTQYYGIESLHLSVTLPQNKDHAKENILSLTFPFGDHPKTITQTLYQDLTSNIWAGDKAQAILTATDVTGKTTTSSKVDFILPKRQFTSLLAQKLDQIRQAYGTNKLSKDATIQALKSLQNIPNAFSNYDLFLNYVGIICFLDNANNNSDSAKNQALTRLWELTIDTEERNNSSSEVARANMEIRAAQASVQEQLDKMQRLGKDKVTNQDRQELSRRLERLQNAVAQKMMAMAKQNAKEHPTKNDGKEIQFKSTRSFQDMFQDMSKTIESGDMDKAMQQLEYTNQVLNTMRNATAEDLKKLEDQVKAQQDMKKLEQDLESLIKDQQALLNQSYARQSQSVPLILRPNQDLNQLSTPELLKQITPQLSHAQSDKKLPSAQESAQKQQELIDRLQKLQEQMQAITKQPIENLMLASNEMKDAHQALQNKDDHKAAESQEKALINLQKGNQSAKQTMQKQAQQFSNFFPTFSARNPQEDPSSDNKASTDKNKDPLGRKTNPDNKNNTEMDLSGNPSSARHIEEELRKRADDPNRSNKDLDYIYRLLNMF